MQFLLAIISFVLLAIGGGIAVIELGALLGVETENWYRLGMAGGGLIWLCLWKRMSRRHEKR